MASWQQTARRIRVPLSFAFAAVYLWLAQPSWSSIAAGSVVALPGLWLRALASGHVHKDTELATTGPYAYARNPLYAGSLILAAGFAVAARSSWVVLLMLAMVVGVYLPVIRSEEEYLRRTFPEFEEYARRVPRLLPRVRAEAGAQGNFSWELYRRHREYNAVLGAAGMMAALAAKLIWLSH
ncbi:MAG: isoprenylcysteine carboxylmethyltransferase family protein [Acidobacteria bacterium]|nr:isoprenylcysteine carboxylmethyltransferase family protein [Acidobacteriota bacterium]